MNRQNQAPASAQAVLDFWFGELTPAQWWTKDVNVDRTVTSRFSDLYSDIFNSVPDDWLAVPRGRLAAVIVLDQFPRNMFRGDARSFESDEMALQLARETIDKGWDLEIESGERAFLYMPYQHSEDAEVQARSVELFTALGNENNLDFAIKHKEIIDRFGRFPHRNSLLGRESTAEELEFLNGPALFW